MGFCLQSHAQSSSAVKPSKVITIKYLNEKLNENATGIVLITDEVWNLGKHVGMDTKRTESRCYQYNIMEENNSAFIVFNIRQKNFSGHTYSNKPAEFNTVYINSQCKIPVSKIHVVNSVKQAKDTSYNNSSGYKRIIILASGIRLLTTGNNIIHKNTETNDITYDEVTLLPVYDDIVAEKLKKAILNLQSFYKKDIDPFDN